jgi:2-methylcitrate dehydratase PrpD
VSNSNMSDVNMQHLLAVTLLDGALSFDAAHDMPRMKNRKVLELKKRIELIPSAALNAARPARQCIIEIATRDGRQLRHHTLAVRGTAENPMSRAEVAEKSLDLVAPALGKRRGKALIATVLDLDQVADVRALRSLLSA